ncbi:MAG: aldo/keto reductase [Chloroflexi bacterium]|nr:aldo/keto reductase [Chloroflexota bacterium]MCL5275765.1 aldo/keto reductase [Chloroflexota bacterium]
MKTRLLGKTGLQVSELALGGLFVSSYGGDYDQARAAIHRALELGVNYIDTAPGYGNSEEVLGKALDGVKTPFIMSTKLGGRPQPFKPQDRDSLMFSVEESLRILKRDHIDILMIHEPDRPGQYNWWSDPVNFDGPVMGVLADLKRQGIVRYIGLGGTTAYELPHIINTGRFDVVLTAFNYSLLWREAEREVLPAAIRQGMGIVIGSPLQQGALARRYDEEVRHGARWLSSPRRAQYIALYDFLDEVGIPLAELGLRFVLSNPHISCTLMGARSREEVEQNVAAAEKGPLPADVLARLDQIAAMAPFRPFEEPFGLPFNREYWGPAIA